MCAPLSISLPPFRTNSPRIDREIVDTEASLSLHTSTLSLPRLSPQSTSTAAAADYDEQLLLELSRKRPGVGHPEQLAAQQRMMDNADREGDMDIDPAVLQVRERRGRVG